MDDKRVIHRTDDFTVYVEPHGGYIWVHCDVRRWGASVARQMVRLAPSLFEPFGRVFAIHEGCAKHAKFLTLMGFGFVERRQTSQGNTISIYGR